MKKRWFIPLMVIAALLGACSAPAPSKLVDGRFECDSEEIIQVRFSPMQGDNGAARLWRHVEREDSGEPMVLRQAAAPQGGKAFLFTSDTVRVLSFGKQLSLEVAGMAPVRCRAWP